MSQINLANVLFSGYTTSGYETNALECELAEKGEAKLLKQILNPRQGACITIAPITSFFFSYESRDTEQQVEHLFEEIGGNCPQNHSLARL